MDTRAKWKGSKLWIAISTTRLLTMSQSWFQNNFWNHNWTIFLLQNWQNVRYKQTSKNWNFQLLFVCLFTCLFVPHILPIRKRKMVQSWFQKLLWNQDWDVVSNLVVEIAIYNFDLFHSALKAMPDISRKIKNEATFEWTCLRLGQ